MNLDFDKLIHGFSLVLSYVVSKPDSFWYAVGLTLGSAIAASTILEVLTRRYAKKWDIKMGKRLIASLLGFLSFMSSGADAVITNSVYLSPLLQRFAWIVTLAVAYHHFIGNKLAQRVIEAAGKWSGAKDVPPVPNDQPAFSPAPGTDGVATTQKKPELLQL